MPSAGDLTVNLLPRGLRMGSAPQWGLQREDGTWLTWPPDGRPAYFMNEGDAARYAKSRASARGLLVAEQAPHRVAESIRQAP